MAAIIEEPLYASYYNWITLFKNIETPIGELATNIAGDPCFPKYSDSPQEILDYIYSSYLLLAGEHSSILETFQYSWLLYKFEIGEAIYKNGRIQYADSKKI